MEVLTLPYSENYIENRINRFYEEFLSDEQSYEHLEKILAIVHDYLLLCNDGENTELYNAIINLRQAIFWIDQWTQVEVESE